MPGRVPKGELDCFAAGFVLRVGDVVFENCGYVFLGSVSGAALVGLRQVLLHLGKEALAVADQETCLSTSAISYYHEFLGI